jgi:nardilysin
MVERKKMRLDEESKSGSPIISSLSDKREYRIITLENGIEAVLVKIPSGQSSKAAISVAVKAGSMDEPDEFGGLAHFVEHCIFLGNTKYPTRNSLDKLLAKHNGYSNAHTELEYTAYYLEVNKEALSKATDIFSSAFISPSFDTDMCLAELEAVDSEFHEIVNNDECRIEQMICSLSSEGHKYKKFTWGNHSSLMKAGGPALVTAAKTFFENHYSADRMKLCMVSSNSFEKMSSLMSAFSAIPLRGNPNQTGQGALSNISFPIPSTALPLTLSMIPVAELHQLILQFQLPSVTYFYVSKPADYLAHIIGHEAEGSLIDGLRRADLASELSAGVGGEGYSSNSGMSMFEIKLTLTKKGLREWKRIPSEFVFPYLDRVKSDGISDTVYAELREIGQVSFNYTSEEFTKDPIDTAEELAILLLDHFKVDRQHLLIHDFVYSQEFDAKDIELLLSFIAPERAIVILVSPEAGPTNQTDPVFGISYCKHPPNELEKFSSSEFVVPPLANRFIPKLAGQVMCVGSEQFVQPSSVITSENLRMYCFQSIRSQPSSKTDVRIRLNLSPVGGSVIQSFVACHLRASYLTDLLEPKLYCAKLAGFGISIAAVPPSRGNELVGIEVTVNGFHEHVIQVLGFILNADAHVDTERLERIFDMLRRAYSNEELHPVSTQAVNIRKVLLAPSSFFRAKDKLNALLGLDRVQTVSESLDITSADIMVTGSQTADLCDSIKSLVSSKIEGTKTDSKFVNDSPVVSKISSETLVVEATHNANEPTSCLVMYYQISDEFSIEKSAIADVLSDLMSEPFFDCLRTEEQLGYSVQCGCRYTNGSIGLEFMIQSSCETPERMVDLVERFIHTFYTEQVEALTDEDFDDQIAALVESLVEPPSSLSREGKDLWTEITENRFLYDINLQTKKEIEAKFLSNKPLVKQIIDQYLVKERRVVVHVNGAGKRIVV